jgi:polyvinyl alcohol dehydrogenase (cytochrome)
MLIVSHCVKAIVVMALLCACSAAPEPSAPPAPRQTAPVEQSAPSGGTPATVPAMTASAAPAAGSGGAAPAVTSGAGSAAPAAAGGSVAPPASVAGSAGAAQAPTEPSAAEPSAVDWTMMGYDPASTYFNQAETTITKQNVANLKEVWTADMGGPVYGAPLQVGDVIYAAGPATVRAFKAATGEQLWMTSVTSTSTLGYAGGTLYVDTPDSTIVALDAASGMKLWTKPHNQGTQADGNSSPIPVGDFVYIGGSNGNMELAGGGNFRGYLSALDRMTGEIVWSSYTVPEGARGASIWSTPSIDVEGGMVYGSTGNNYGAPATDSSDAIIQFDLETGAIKWKAQRVQGDTFGAGVGPDADFGANPVLYETMVGGVLTKVVSAGNKGGDAHAIRRDDGSLLWTRDLGGGSATGSAGVFTNSTWTGKNMLFAQNQNGPATLFALDGATGDVVWERPLPGQVWGRLAVANGVGFVGTGSNLAVFDVDTGEIIKMYPTKGGTLASGITVSRGRVAFGEGLSWSGGVYGSTLHVLAVQ